MTDIIIEAGDPVNIEDEVENVAGEVDAGEEQAEEVTTPVENGALMTGLIDTVRSSLDAIQSLRVDLMKEQALQAEIMTAALTGYADKVDALTAAIQGLPKNEDDDPEVTPPKARESKTWL